jgi:hypothetical protein
MMDMAKITERIKEGIENMVSSELGAVQDIVDSINEVQDATKTFIETLQNFSDKIDSFKKGGNNISESKETPKEFIDSEQIIRDVMAPETTKTDQVREIFKEFGPLTTAQVIEKCIERKMAENKTEEEILKFKNTIRYILHDLKGREELVKSDNKRETPWVSTNKLLQKE